MAKVFSATTVSKFCLSNLTVNVIAKDLSSHSNGERNYSSNEASGLAKGGTYSCTKKLISKSLLISVLNICFFNPTADIDPFGEELRLAKINSGVLIK